MKRFVAAQVVVAVAATTSLAAQDVRVLAENPLSIERREEVISVSWPQLTRTLKNSSATRIRVTDAQGRELLSQVIDNEPDGKPDELLFIADFWPLEKKAFVVTAEAPTQKAEPRVFIRHDDPRDDIAWESDRIAFRI